MCSEEVSASLVLARGEQQSGKLDEWLFSVGYSVAVMLSVSVSVTDVLVLVILHSLTRTLAHAQQLLACPLGRQLQSTRTQILHGLCQTSAERGHHYDSE
jgi:hypothetical protein